MSERLKWTDLQEPCVRCKYGLVDSADEPCQKCCNVDGSPPSDHRKDMFSRRLGEMYQEIEGDPVSMLQMRIEELEYMVLEMRTELLMRGKI